jgi:hypothetical protein
VKRFHDGARADGSGQIRGRADKGTGCAAPCPRPSQQPRGPLQDIPSALRIDPLAVITPPGRCEEIDRCAHPVIVTYSLTLYSAGMSNMPAPPLPRLASIDRSQLLLHTLDVERLIDEDHSARSIWHLVGRMNLSLYHAKIAALEGRAGRDHTAPQLLISLWLYAYSQGISSAREIARQCAFEPGFAGEIHRHDTYCTI